MLLSKEIIGKRISDVRKRAGKTQAELSEEIGISEKYLSRIECGKQLPSIVIVAKICEVFCISADNLLGQTTGYNSSKGVQNEMSSLSSYEQNRIVDIIRIIKDMKNHT